MSGSDALWRMSFSGLAGAGLSVYDELMVPRMFEPWARLLADALEINTGERILDVACGPGTVTRVAAARAGSSGRVIGCDLSPRMLALARAKPRGDGCAAIEYHQAPADRLPLPDGELDVVACQQGLQFFPDRAAALAEMRRVLRLGGRVGIAVWSEIEHSPAFCALADALELVAGSELAARYRGGPYGFTDAGALRDLLETIGFTEIDVSRRTLSVRFDEGAAQVVTTLAATPLAEAIDQLSAQQQRELVDAVAAQTGNGQIDSTMEAHIALARR